MKGKQLAFPSSFILPPSSLTPTPSLTVGLPPFFEPQWQAPAKCFRIGSDLKGRADAESWRLALRALYGLFGSSPLELWKNTLTEHPQTSFGSQWCRYATLSYSLSRSSPSR